MLKSCVSLQNLCKLSSLINSFRRRLTIYTTVIETLKLPRYLGNGLFKFILPIISIIQCVVKSDAEETERKNELREKAKKELDDWYRHHAEQLEKTKENNR